MVNSAIPNESEVKTKLALPVLSDSTVDSCDPPLTTPKLVTNFTCFLPNGVLFALRTKTLTSTLSPTLAVSGQANIKEVWDDGSAAPEALANPEKFFPRNIVLIKTPKTTKNNIIKPTNLLSI
ncbi:hypothetical protein CANDROIZ_210009 [Candidatus Roizmanbacteria bacterium]|nr:hypothetical protein CANDROIZ_210009 [Candidatus Roizmanbacteria bacterium]